MYPKMSALSLWFLTSFLSTWYSPPLYSFKSCWPPYEYGATSLNTLRITAMVSIASRFYRMVLQAPCLTNFKFRVVYLLDWVATKIREPSLLYYLTHNWREKRWILTFPKGICVKANVTNSTGIWTLLDNFNTFLILKILYCSPLSVQLLIAHCPSNSFIHIGKLWFK